MASADMQLYGVLVAVCVVLLTILLYIFYQKGKGTRRGVLITGISNTGKTLLFARLIHDKYVDSHTSIKENLAEYETLKGSLQIIDIPGHERLRETYLTQYKKTARALIYVIDSTNFQKDIRDVAEYLHLMLTDPIMLGNCKNVLIFCNKQDNPMAKGISVIQSHLQKELNTVRMTKASMLSSLEESGAKQVFLGKEGVDFDFSHIPNVKFVFAEGCVYNKTSDGKPNIESIRDWLQSI